MAEATNSRILPDRNFSGDSPILAQPLARGSWSGDGDILPFGAEVEVLALDSAGRMTATPEGFCVDGVPARTACWVRHWPEGRGVAQFRSCDLADIELPDAEFDRLFALTQASATGPRP